MTLLLEKLRHLIVVAFFFIFFIVGMLIFKDYGVHWDEYKNQSFGERWTNYIYQVLKTGSLIKPVPKEIPNHDLVHGPFIEIGLTLIKDGLKLTDSRSIILMRHFSVFLLFFGGSIIFYFLCLGHFKNWKFALLGTIFLVLNPRIFSHAFYNTVDIGFLVFFTLAMFSLIKFLDKKTWGPASLHALTCALACDVRLLGSLTVFFTVSLMLMDLPRQNQQQKSKIIKLLFYYLFLFSLFFILFCPLWWSNPYSNILLSLKTILLDLIPSPEPVFYLGRLYPHNSLPWHYAPLWILISTPLIYIFLFLLGCIAAIKTFFKKNSLGSSTRRDMVLFFCWFFVPLFITKGRIYNSWRHLFFIYPAFVLIAVNGLHYIWYGFQNKLPKNVSILFRPALAFILLISLCLIASLMIKNHPFEEIYFNRLAGKNLKEASDNFDLNYWGTSDKQALEYILENDHSPSIPIKFNDNNSNNNFYILPRTDRKRLVCVNTISKAKYFITQYKRPKIWPFKNEFYSIKIQGVKIVSVFRLN